MISQISVVHVLDIVNFRPSFPDTKGEGRGAG